jgi:hypothetical protein
MNQSATQQEIFNKPYKIVQAKHRAIYDFPVGDNNIDHVTVDSFGEEWKAFHGFDQKEIMKLGEEYFDIVTDEMVNVNTSLLEVGCGSGRFLK